MTSLAERFGLGLAGGCRDAGRRLGRDQHRPRRGSRRHARRAVRQSAGAAVSSATASTSSDSGFDGRVGIAVKSIDEGWATGWKADELYPQQSVSKLWVAITALDAVDRGTRRARRQGDADAATT